jgi:hypothetical protein
MVWASVVSSGVMAHVLDYSHDAAFAVRNSDASPFRGDMATAEFGSLKAPQLESLYRQASGSFSQLPEQNKKLVMEKEKLTNETKSKTYYDIRQVYKSNQGSQLKKILQQVPKGNYAHLHFNAYLPSTVVNKLFKQEQSKDLFQGQDVSAFVDTMEDQIQPYGDLMSFPEGPLESRADKYVSFTSAE